MYNALDSEYKSSIQELDNQVKVPILRSSISDSRPILSESEINDMLDMTFRCSSKVQEVTSSKNGDYSHMTLVIDQVAVTMVGIQKTMARFQKAECLEQCRRQLEDRVISASFYQTCTGQAS